MDVGMNTLYTLLLIINGNVAVLDYDLTKADCENRIQDWAQFAQSVNGKVICE